MGNILRGGRIKKWKMMLIKFDMTGDIKTRRNGIQTKITFGVRGISKKNAFGGTKIEFIFGIRT
jgi:hypothetical protein